MKMRFLLLIPAVPFLFNAGCTGKPKNGEETVNIDNKAFAENYSVTKFLTPEEADNLLVDIITYIGKKPPLADYRTRFNPEYRNFYRQQKDAYQFVYYHVCDDSTHLFCIDRPARSVEGNRRGVGGYFRLSPDLKITAFEESFNTPVSDQESLMRKGAVLFQELITHRNIDRFLGDTALIAWPDRRMKYDKERFEWRYISDLQDSL